MGRNTTLYISGESTDARGSDHADLARGVAVGESFVRSHTVEPSSWYTYARRLKSTVDDEGRTRVRPRLLQCFGD